MKKTLGILVMGLFLCSNSFAAMLTVTTGGTIAAASDIVDDADIDNQREAIHKTAATQNNTVIGMQYENVLNLTIKKYLNKN